VLWLVFSVLKKIIGLFVLAAIALAAFVLWQNPTLLRSLLALVQNVV
jgi:hypothetical protein